MNVSYKFQKTDKYYCVHRHIQNLSANNWPRLLTNSSYTPTHTLYIYIYIYIDNSLGNIQLYCSHSVVANVLDCDIIVSEFEL